MLAVTSRSVRLLPAFDQYVVTATRQADHLAAWSGAELELAFTEAA